MVLNHYKAYHYDPLYNGTAAECAWGMYDQKCYDSYENYFDYDHRLTICTNLPETNFLPRKSYYFIIKYKFYIYSIEIARSKLF